MNGKVGPIFQNRAALSRQQRADSAGAVLYFAGACECDWADDRRRWRPASGLLTPDVDRVEG
jgi:hypothetical protein